MFVRRLLYRLKILKSHRAGGPVIVVGNLVAGGSGKTPLVLWLAEFLKDRGWTPGIVSRGYGARLEAPREATIASEPGEVGDEPIVLARRSGCTVWVGPDRVRVCEALRHQHPDVDIIVLDDGLPESLTPLTYALPGQLLAESVARRLRHAGLTATSEVRQGDAASEIVSSARSRNRPLVILGSRGHTGLARLLLGWVARNSLTHAAGSVLLVGQGAGVDPEPGHTTGEPLAV